MLSAVRPTSPTFEFMTDSLFETDDTDLLIANAL